MAGILGLSLAACDDTSDLGKPQVNTAPNKVEANGATVTEAAALTGEVLNLGDYVNANIPVFDIALDNTFPESAAVQGTFQVAANEDFTGAVEIPVSMEALPEVSKAEGEAAAPRKYVGVISGNAWEDAFVSFFGNDPNKKTCWYRYLLTIADGTQILELTGDYVAGKEIEVIPVDQKLDVESAYYIYGAYIGGSIANAVEMSHTDKHQYDDPNFSYVATVTEENAAHFNWVIAPKSSYDDKNNSVVYGVEDPAKMEGNLVLMSKGGKAGQISNVGGWRIEVNMLKKTYKIALAAETLYVIGPGAGSGFGPNALQIGTTDYVNYKGMGIIKTGFKLAAQKSLNSGVFYGLGDAEGNLAIGAKAAEVENCPVDVKKSTLCLVSADLAKMTYTAAPVTEVGLIGAFNEWKDDLLMTQDKSKLAIWKATVTIPQGEEGWNQWKFRFNKSWDFYNLGGTENNLTFNGDNLTVSEPGTYEVTLDMTKLPYSCKVTKK